MLDPAPCSGNASGNAYWTLSMRNGLDTETITIINLGHILLATKQEQDKTVLP